MKKITLELDRIEEDKSVLFTEDGMQVVLPKEIIPKESREGDYLILTISTDEAETKQREKTAKEILNEILNIQ